MNLVEKAFVLLYPDKDPSKFSFSLAYSGKFSAYNGRVKYGFGGYNFNISKQWRHVSEEIQMGLIQHLLQKVFKTRIKSLHQDLYNSFMKNVHISVPKTHIEPELKESFDRVNEKYFLGVVEMPNLAFGQRSFRKMGSYEYGSDTITISTVFKGISDDEKVLLDYIMYHEMLHKVHKFKASYGKSRHHTGKFRFAEKQFEGFEHMESALSKFLRKKRFKNFFGLN
jgi:hypothetical protein